MTPEPYMPDAPIHRAMNAFALIYSFATLFAETLNPAHASDLGTILAKWTCAAVGAVAAWAGAKEQA